MVVTPVVLANNFIMRALEENTSMSPMKLQKLIYLLYREYLRETGSRLFAEPFEAWQYGPVLSSVYDEFRPFGAKSINRFARNSAGEVYTVQEEGVFKRCFDTIWNKYANRSAWDLSMLTHTPGGAWDKTWKANERYLRDDDIANEQY